MHKNSGVVSKGNFPNACTTCCYPPCSSWSQGSISISVQIGDWLESHLEMVLENYLN